MEFMPLSPPQTREPIHRRAIECEGFRRTDGLWDIEGHLIDVKSYAFDNAYRGGIAAGEPVHDMRIRLTVDDDFLIHHVEAVSEATPYAPCGDIASAYRALEGLRIGAGFSRAVAQRLGGAAGCTHHSELVGRMATVAIQTIAPLRRREAAGKTSGSDEGVPTVKPPHLDRCYALRTDGAVVRAHYPAFYTGPTQSGPWKSAADPGVAPSGAPESPERSSRSGPTAEPSS
jgi:hypothetical protein